ncbi:hypothetical protein MUK71_07315 [Arthrobacter zhangbolii]|uniref:Uncharacterized protein n=1 Tax=Arthrobacter zhangbolii TaxID=2886936 RepID=A0A9X1SAD6_9MICC|nr:hypothetical protein [Arthrobacter zhangbolii]MCC3271769.1 hypothetical protein [Arthrobacter zhangbolii]UON93404.1 hypothetical protein MUK71_07315 [Arthrobacter zhangbolii]
MARNSLLDRFRPVGAPGPAGPAGVPAQDDEGPAAELIPVFEALDPQIEAAQATAGNAAEQARESVAAARRQAAALLEQARMDSAAARAEAAAQVSAEVSRQDEALLSEARQEAAELRRRGESRVPELASAIVADLVQVLLGRGTDSG